jgi:F0F1-type ATP synthase epsilon subunit
MSEFTFSLLFMSGPSVQGTAERLFIKDEKIILTINSNHAPLVATLENGFVQVIKKTGESTQYNYEQAFLNCHDNTATLTVLQ